jgi:hypothetical protein
MIPSTAQTMLTTTENMPAKHTTTPIPVPERPRPSANQETMLINRPTGIDKTARIQNKSFIAK